MDDGRVCTLLFDLLGARGDRAAEIQAGDLPLAAWEEIATGAASRDLAPLLYRKLTSLRLADRVPAPALERLREAYLRSAKRNLRLGHELAKMLRRFADGGIPVIVLKGACLAESVYGNPALRPMNDVDLLVRRGDLSWAERTMLEAGYGPRNRPSVEAQCYESLGLLDLCRQDAGRDGVVCFDVHWNFEAAGSGFQVGVDGLWARSRWADIAGVPAYILGHEDMLLHVCLHAGYHHAFDGRLKSLCDIAQICQRYRGEIDWEELRLRAGQWGCRRCAYLALRLAREWLDAPVPEHLLSALGPPAADGPWIALAQELALRRPLGTDDSLWMTPNVSHFLAGSTVRQKVAVLVDRLFPPRRELAKIYSAPDESLRIYSYYPIRIKDLAMRWGRTIWRTLRGDEAVRATVEHANRKRALQAWLEAEPKGSDDHAYPCTTA